jgi:hypothetical protein
LDKKGFLFTVTVFLILTYILLSISVWVKAVETSERSYSEFYKESTVELAIEQITPAKIDNITNIVMNRALFRLNENSIDHPVKAGPSGAEDAYISDALNGLLVDGNVPNSDFQDNTNMTDDGSSLTDWVSNLNASLLAIGVYVSDFKISNFNVVQGDMETLNYSFDLALDLKDYSNTSSVTRTYHLNNTLAISGLVDPALARKTKNTIDDQHTVYRQFFFNQSLYSKPGSISVSQRSGGTAGQGWYYGYLASATPSSDPLVPDATSVDPSRWGNYIITGTFQQIVSVPNYDSFAGYIVTNAPETGSNCSIKASGEKIPNEMGTFNPIKYSGTDCDKVSVDPTSGAWTSKPFIVAPGFIASDAPECPIFSGSITTHGKCALITNKWLASDVANAPLEKLDNSASAIYGVEQIRDFVMCGYYTQDPAAPSYFQRLLPDSYSRNDSSLGIETFVIGESANSTAYNHDSRLDRELLNSTIPGIKIMGLPGCRNYESCADTPSTGIFMVSQDVVEAYGLGNISCSGTRCG